MKIHFLLVIVFSLVSCTHSVVEKPERLIDKEVMVDILCDIAILQSAENFNTALFSEKNIKINDLIYKRYNIDSVSFAQSNRYYAANPHQYQKMFKQVAEKIAQKKEALTEKSSKENARSNVTSNNASLK